MKKQIMLLIATFATSSVASAQLVSFGAKGGVPFIEQLPGNDESRPYIVGPFIEFRLPAGFALEVDALYRRIGSSSPFFSLLPGVSFVSLPSVATSSERLRGNEWQFPILGRYYFRRSSTWQPFVAIGYAFRTIGTHQDFSDTIFGSDGTSHIDSFHVNSRSDLGVGAVVALGARFRAGRIALSPEIRYTRWGSQNNIFVRKNEAAFLLGISF